MKKAKLSQLEKVKIQINLNHGHCTHLSMRLLSGYFYSLITIKFLLSYRNINLLSDQNFPLEIKEKLLL
jgi:hypothetical protein